MQLDIFITDLIFNLPSPTWLTFLFRFFSLEGWFLLLWLIMFLYVYKMRIVPKQRLHLLLELTIVLFILNTTINVVIKPFFARPRPYYNTIANHPKVQTKTYPSDFSFPSGHATLAFAGATLLATRDKKLKWAYFLLAGLVAFSRVYLGYHYFFDVAIGGLLGWISTRVFIKKLTLN